MTSHGGDLNKGKSLHAFIMESHATRNISVDSNTTTTAFDGDINILCNNGFINLTNSQWIINFDASYHITSHRDFFTLYAGGQYGYMKMRNNVECKIAGIEDVCLKTNNEYKLLLKNIIHIPDICLNLISILVLDGEGYQNYFGKEKWKFTRGYLMVTEGIKYCSI